MTDNVPNGGVIATGQVWTVAQWNNAWTSKVDATNGTLSNPTVNNGTFNNPTITGAITQNPTISGATIDNSLLGGTTPNNVWGTRFASSPTSSQLQIVGSGTVDGQSVNWEWGRMRLAGTITGPDPLGDGQSGANKIIYLDAAAISGASNASAYYVLASYSGNTSSSNVTYRNATHSRVTITGQLGVANTIGQVGTNMAFVSQLSTGYATASQGGPGGWSVGLNPSLGYFRGSLFGGNDNVWLTGNATNYFYLIGREIDVSIQSTSSVYTRFGLLVSGFPSTKQASDDDAAIAIVSQTVDGKNFKNGIQFGAAASNQDITGALIKVVPRQYPSPATPAFTDGIDISGGTFSGNAFKSPGFNVDGSGKLSASSLQTTPSTPSSSSAAGTPGQIAVDSGFIYVCTATNTWKRVALTTF